MHNINYIRENATAFDNAMKQRGELPCSEKILKIDEEKRNTQTVLQNILAERNKLSKEIGILKSKNQNITSIVTKVETLKDQILSLKELEKIKNDELNGILTRIPNIPSKDVPSGINANDNVEYRQWGKKQNFNFNQKNILKLVKI